MHMKVHEGPKTLKITIVIASFLAVTKFAVGLLTHSMAIMASALDSLMDAGTSTVNFIAMKKALEPPDAEHAYGHGKIESLVGLFESLFFGFSGLYLIYESVRRWVMGTVVEAIPIGIAMMVLSMIFTYFIVWNVKRSSREGSSIILTVTQLHYGMDFLTNAGIILALGLVHFTGYVFWDLLLSVGIAAYVFKLSFGILGRSINELLDRSLPVGSVMEIKEMIFLHNPAVVNIHRFRSRCVGEKIFLDFHIEIRGERDFGSAHEITESLIENIRTRYPGADVTIHFDPEGAN